MNWDHLTINCYVVYSVKDERTSWIIMMFLLSILSCAEGRWHTMKALNSVLLSLPRVQGDCLTFCWRCGLNSAPT